MDVISSDKKEPITLRGILGFCAILAALGGILGVVYLARAHFQSNAVVTTVAIGDEMTLFVATPSVPWDSLSQASKRVMFLAEAASLEIQKKTQGGNLKVAKTDTLAFNPGMVQFNVHWAKDSSQ